jgi:hypothetical protein
MVRDGIDPRPPAGTRLGENAWCFTQVLSFVPPQVWSGAWNRHPAQILDAARKHEWEEALMEGWKEAALRAQDAEWLEAMANYEFKNGSEKRLLEWFPRLPASIKERLVVSLLREHPSLSYEQNASLFLAACRHPWGPDLTQVVVDCICQTLQQNSLPAWRWEKLLRDIPPYFHPDLLPSSIERIAAALQVKTDSFVAGLLSTLEFRLEMHRAFVSYSVKDPP